MKKLITTALVILGALYGYSQTYLPLSGGTLTGPLGLGISNVDNSIKLQSDSYIGWAFRNIGVSSEQNTFYKIGKNTAYVHGLYFYSSGQDVATDDAFIFGSASNSANIRFKANGAASFAGALTGTSAMFDQSSGIGMTVRSDWDASATNNSQLYLTGSSNTNQQLRLGYATHANYGYIQALVSGTNVQTLALNPSGGNIGIGTTTPSSPLQVSAIKTKSLTGLWHTSITDLTSQSIGVGGGITFTGYKTAQSNFEQFAAIDGYKENSTSSDASGAFRILTQPSTGAGLQEWMRVTSMGNVGIGTTNPGAKLELYESEPRIYFNGTRASDPRKWEIGSEYIDESNGMTFAIRDMTTSGSPIRMTVNKDGNVAIGTTNPQGYKLAVAGKMIAEEVKVALQGSWPDYVFKPGNKLRSLQEVEDFVQVNNHLPEMPSEAEVKKDGINLGEMDAKLLKKIEELTLYMIDFKKEMDLIKSENQTLKTKVAQLEASK